MVIDVKIVKCKSEDLDVDALLNSGEYFSGSIYHDTTNSSWTAFNLVNKEKMSYILKHLLHYML